MLITKLIDFCVMKNTTKGCWQIMNNVLDAVLYMFSFTSAVRAIERRRRKTLDSIKESMSWIDNITIQYLFKKNSNTGCLNQIYSLQKKGTLSHNALSNFHRLIATKLIPIFMDLR